MWTVRLADSADADSLRMLIEKFRDELGATQPSDAMLVESVPELLADPDVEFCLAESPEGDGVGYTQMHYFRSLWVGGAEATLDDLFVTAEARRKRAGAALLGRALEGARARGARLVGLNTNERNRAAQELYAQAGFRPQSEPLWRGGREIRLLKHL